MNYRHAFHAGNFADVAKHATLALLLQRLAEKPKPFFALDTHAGLGEYDLLADAAARTGEWRQGIDRIWDRTDAPAAMAPYLDAIRAFNPGGALRWYPGSPRLVRAAMRAGDRLVACELHEDDARTLRRTFEGERGIEIVAGDGYAALKSRLPPPERRGLVLVDPPFERKDEFETLAKALRDAHRRFATGCFFVWYPVKGRETADAFLAGIGDGRIRRVAVAELMRHAPDDARRLNGCGILTVNAPWRFSEAVKAALEWTHAALDCAGGVRVEELVGE